MHDDGAARHVSWLFMAWQSIKGVVSARLLTHGISIVLLRLGLARVHSSLLIARSPSICRQYIADTKRARRLSSQIGNVEFNLSERLIDCGSERRIDIATFRIFPHEIGQLGKKVVVAQPAQDNAHTATPPKPRDLALFGGFLGTQRIFIAPNEVSFGLHLGMTPVTDFTDRQIRCRLDRHHWVDTRGLGLPLPGFDLGGVSGGPLLVPIHVDDRWSWRLAGVVSEAQMHREYEVIIAERAHFILPDGRVG